MTEKEELFTTTELTSFGEYLLSVQRLQTLHADADPSGVYHSDVTNWKAKVGGAGVEIGEADSEQWGYAQRVSLALKTRKETGEWAGEDRALCMQDPRAAAVIHANGW